MSSYVGGCAEKVRKLFEKAFEDQKKLGYESPIHIIFIDEIDALCPKRGSNSSVDGGASDQVVGQFLTLIDGIQKLSNILVIGTTNRINSIDEALLRPGRLDKHYHVPVPNEKARRKIWAIHTKNLIENSIAIEKDIDTLSNVELTGAEIQGIVSQAIIIARSTSQETGPG